MLPLALATEDALSEAIGLRILADFATIPVGVIARQNGDGYLRSRLRNFCEMALHEPVLLLTDLDTAKCAVELKHEWLRERRQPKNLLFRVVVREIESWLLADHEAMVMLFGPSIRSRLPANPDSLPGPKEFLLGLARRGPRNVRQDLLPANNSSARKGFGYNNCLCGLVRAQWQPHRAALLSPSLRRAMSRVAELAD